MQRLFQQLVLIESFGLKTSPLRWPSLRIATLATFDGGLGTAGGGRLPEDAAGPLGAGRRGRRTEDPHGLAQGFYDFGLVHSPLEGEDGTSKTLATSIIVCLLPKDHRLAAQERVTSSARTS